MAVPLKGGKPRNAIVEESFGKINDDRFKGARAACKYCQKELDKNTSRLQNQLDVFKNHQEAVKLGQTSGALRAPKNWSQQQITTVVRSSPQKRAEHWTREAKAVYITNLPFSHYENKYVAAHLHVLHSSYKALSDSVLVGHLLDQCYEKVKDKVDARLLAPRFLNFYMDKSNNICKDCVINFLAHAPKRCDIEGGCFYIHSESYGARTMDAKTQPEWLIMQMTQTTEGKLWRMNSLTTNTCNLMRALWKSLKKDPRLEHIFCAPFDGHGIQLLIKDILSIKWYSGVI